MNEIATVPTEAPLSATQIKQQVNLIQEVMREVMQGPSKENPTGTHFGIIPGCAKPSLYKAGAEKLSMTFRLRPIIDNDRDVNIGRMDSGHRDIRVYCHVFNMGGMELATGVGSCSTMESKFRYRGGEKTSTGQPVPKEYWNLKKEGKAAEAIEKIGGPGFGVAKFNGSWEICEFGEKMENPDIADTYNTVLKMAKKRAYVDGILSATAASDIFTQDIEDMPEMAKAAEAVPVNGKPEVAMPQEKTNGDKRLISDKQGNRLLAIASTNGYTKELVLEYVKGKHGLKHLRDITTDIYDAVVAHFEGKDV